jgi:hypothetical protein
MVRREVLLEACFMAWARSAFARIAAIGCLLTAVLVGCAKEIGDDPPPAGDAAIGDKGGRDGDMDAGFDGGKFGNANPDEVKDNATPSSDASTNPDAFFINDPPPPYCGPEEDRPDDLPSGTVECPSDKNREGCSCPKEGQKAACWPGKRINRDHGICKDGETTCENTTEFGLRWGPCEGYVLPKEDALVGPDACGCFSSGTWMLSNISPCIFREGDRTYLYSARLLDNGMLACGENISAPPPVPTEGSWSTSAVRADCAGEFRLCFTIKAGDRDNPEPDDCVIYEDCVDVTYETEGELIDLPDLPHWTSSEVACSTEFDRIGGYGEMSVRGESIECDPIDDGMGNPYVFLRTNYCPPSCDADDESDACKDCKTGGSGDF